MNSYSVIVLLSFVIIELVDGHGYLFEPPNRSSLWRYGFHTPPNYDDNQLFCGGFDNQWNEQGGKCGICGDPYQDEQPRANEAGGTYGLGIIIKKYEMGQTIDIGVNLTTNHMGWFEFRICKNDNIHRIATQACLNDHVLVASDGTGTRFVIPEGTLDKAVFRLRYNLPKELVCSQCVIQWHYNTASNWGTCPDGTQAKGCGPQETFRGCADVSITESLI